MNRNAALFLTVALLACGAARAQSPGFGAPIPSPGDRAGAGPSIPGVESAPRPTPVADDALALLTDVGFTRGHLLVGDELARLERWDEALPHILHPLDEIYPDVAPRLERFGAPPFDDDLERLAQAARSHRRDAYETAYKVAWARLDEAEASVKAASPDWTGIALKASVKIVRQTIGEYETALRGQYVENAVEYQDGRGFAMAGRMCLRSVAPELAAEYGAQFVRDLEADLSEIQKTWPTTVPPRKGVVTPTYLQSTIDWFALHARGLK